METIKFFKILHWKPSFSLLDTIYVKVNNMRDVFNESFFEKIDTQEKAYALGLLFSDGNVCFPKQEKLSPSINLTQAENNSEIVFLFKDLISSKNKVLEIVEKRGQKKYSITVHSKKMAGDLIKCGCPPKKSLSIRFPIFDDENLYHHFIRGYFDGDGCIWNGKRKKMTVKNEKKPGTTRVRIIHNVKFHFTGNKYFITSLQDFLIKNLGFNKTNLNFRFKERSPLVCTMEYSGRKNIKKLYDFMYKDATIFLSRKKRIFEEILCAFDEKSSNEIGLIAGTPLETQEPLGD